ncbi:HupE/UreJ family protein [Lentzea sp. NPDC092896]|uniref:HupE/UreJ family protein n=1 Tax=Lentzea sp. NPDC092896 TaxID=3364127 RepID=UPI003814391D
MTWRFLRRVTAVLLGLLLLGSTQAHAHSLDSSTLSVRVTDNAVSTTVSVAVDTVDKALGVDDATTAEYAAYIGEHLTVTGADGAEWAETVSNPVLEQVEGIESFSVDVALDAAGDPSTFTLTYDGIIEADQAHRAVVVLTDAAGKISTAGVLTADDTSIRIGDAASTGVTDMIGYGFHHVLEGADHLLFLITLLLVAPVALVAGRWRGRKPLAPTARSLLGVVTAFTAGHSLTLIASALGWISLPGTPVEVLIAVSVAVAAVHALRPLARHGENVIAGAFGLVHGLAFAGILSGLGLDGTPSLLALLAFNVGVELAQLVTVALLFPSLYVLSGTRWYRAVRLGGASIALVAAAAWAIDRLGVLGNPLASGEEFLISHPWYVVAGLALLAAASRLVPERKPVLGGVVHTTDGAGSE